MVISFGSAFWSIRCFFEVSGLRAQGSENEPLQLLKKGVQHLAYFF
jgi:hypothetical protein